MTSLPEALRPWATQLSLFPEELALSLGPHIARLSAALGALRPRGEASGGEPMGYDGLARRGTYERLLLTEWLYAEEAPEEFLRRAAFGEHAFLRPSFRQPQGARRSVALLDAGPDQLGAPRLAHLALLVVLARRAEAAGAAFEWAVLQGAPGGGHFQGLTVAGINTWLAARSASPVKGAYLSTWRELLNLGRAPDDVWLVGPARLARFPEASGLSRVEVEEVVEPGLRRLNVQVRPATRAPREVALELPGADACVRLLRDPFASATVAPVKSATKEARVQAVRFSADGTRLLLLRSDGVVIVQALPENPRCTRPRPRQVDMPAGHTLVAVDWRYRGGVVALTQHEGTLALSRGTLEGKHRSMSPRYAVEQLRGRLPRPPSHEELPGQVIGLREGSEERLLVCDGAGGVFALAHPSEAGSPAVAVADNVVAFAEVQRKPIWVSAGTQESGAVRELWLGIWESGHLRHLHLGEGDGEVVFGCAYLQHIGHREAGLIALRQRSGTWRVPLSNGGHADLAAPPGTRVVGVGVGVLTDQPALLVLDADRRGFSLVGQAETRPGPRASDEVSFAVASHSLPVFAWRTVKGEVVVWSLKHSTVLYRLLPPEEP